LHFKTWASLLVLIALAGCGSSTPSTGSKSSAAATRGPLIVKMMGKCRSKVNGGVLYPSVKGFTPGGTFTVNAWYPDGSPYRYLHHQGRVGSDGTLRKTTDPTVKWGWACGDGANGKSDPATHGSKRYTIQFKDDKTGRSTPAYGHKGAVHFRIFPAK
jgi:hypothetical protein